MRYGSIFTAEVVEMACFYLRQFHSEEAEGYDASVAAFSTRCGVRKPGGKSGTPECVGNGSAGLRRRLAAMIMAATFVLSGLHAFGQSPYYDFTVIAKKGDSTDRAEEITSIKPEVSVNEEGRVVFVGYLDTGVNNVLMGDGRWRWVTNISISPSGNYGFPQINNQGIIVARELHAGQSAVETWNANNPGAHTLIASTTLSAFSQLTLPVIGNSWGNQQPLVGFLGREEDAPFNYWGNDTGQRDVQERVSFLSGTALAHLRSMVAETDKRTVVIQYGIEQDDGRVVVWQDPLDVGLWEPTLLASTRSPTDRWISVGRIPGISDSGKFVVFGGESEREGVGVYLSVLDPGSGRDHTPFKILGPDTPIAQRRDGTPVFFKEFDFRNNRVAILHQEFGEYGVEGDSLVIAFVATPTEASRPNPALPGRPFLFTDRRGIWVIRVDVERQLQYPHQIVFNATDPIPVIQEGTKLDGSVIVDLAIYDPLSVPLMDTEGRPRRPSRGDHYIAFAAAMDIDGDQMADENWVLRGAKLDTDGDGLMDHWETRGIDIDADGAMDLDLPALGAELLRKDIFLEIDWLNPRTEGVPRGWSNRLAPGVAQRLAHMFAESPVANPDGTTGVTLHVDAGPGKDALKTPFSINIKRQDLLDGGDEITMEDLPDVHIDVVHFKTDFPVVGGLTTRDFQGIKEEYFGMKDKWARELAFKYCVLADSPDVLYNDSGNPFIGYVTDASTLTLTAASSRFGDVAGHLVKIITGTGSGQVRRIIRNTEHELTIDSAWSVVPDGSSEFVLLAGNIGQAEELIRPAPDYNTRPGNDLLVTLGGVGVNDEGWLGNGSIQWRTIAHEIGHSLGLRQGRYDTYGYDPDYKSLMCYVYLFAFESGITSYSAEDWAELKYDFPISGRFIGSTETAGSPEHPTRAPVPPPLDLTPPGIVITSPEDDCDFSVGIGDDLMVTAQAWDDVGLSHVLILFDVNGDGQRSGDNEVVTARYDHVHHDFRATFTNVGGVFGVREILAYAYDTSDNMGMDVAAVKAGGDPAGAQTLASKSGTIPSQPHQSSGGTRQTVDYTSINVPGSGTLTFTVTASPPVRLRSGEGNRHETTVMRISLDGQEVTLEPVCNPPGCDPAVCTSFWEAPSGGGSLDVQLSGPAVFDNEGTFLGHGSQDYTLKISFEAVDLTPPDVTITRPPAEGFVGISETLVVDANVTDDYGVALVMVSFDINGDSDEDDPGETIAANDLGGGVYRASFPNVSGDAGARPIRVVATDASGHAARETGFVEVRVPDTQPPFVAIKSPPAGWPIKQGETLLVEVNAYDDVGLSSVGVTFDIDGDGATTGAGESILADKTGVNLYTAEFATIAGPNGPRTVNVVASDTSGNTSPADVPVTVGGVEPTTETIFEDSGHIDAQPSVGGGGTRQVIDYDPIEVSGSGTLRFIVTATPPVRQEVQNITRADPYVKNINLNGTDYNLTPECNEFGADPSVCTTTFEATEGGTLDFEILGPGTWNIWGEFSGHHAQDYTIEIEFTSVDITPPEVTITSPALGADVDLGVPLTVDVSVVDEAEVASVIVSFDVDGDGHSDGFGEQLAAGRIAGDNYRAIFAEVSGIPGTRTVEVLATDTSFNSTHKSRTVGVGGVGGGETFLFASSGIIPAQPIDIHGGQRQIIEFDPLVVPGIGRVTLIVTATPNVRQQVQNIERHDPKVVKINFQGQDVSLIPECNPPGSDPAVCISVWDSPGPGTLDFEILGPATYNIWGEFQGHPEQDYTIEVLFLPGPTVVEVTPNTGSVSGHETVTVSGSGFGFNAVVLFGEVPATDVVRVSHEELTCATPPGVPGSVTVKVLNPDPEGLSWNYGGPYGLFGELDNGFTYQAASEPAPLQAERLLGTVKGYFPAVGPEEPQQHETFDFAIPGAGRLRFEAYAFIPILNPIPGPFDDPDNLEWHNESTAVRSFTGGDGAGYWTDVEYSDLSYPYGPVIGNSTRVVGSSAAGPGRFTVKGPARWNAFWRQFGEYEMQSAPSQNWSLAVWYAEPPLLTSVFPASGTEAGGDTVTLTGAKFAEGIQVRFGGAAATHVVVSDENALTCTTPPGLAGLVSVEAELLDMAATLNDAFTYQPDEQRKAITEFSLGPEGTPAIRVQTKVGRTYRLQRNDDLTDLSGWMVVGGEVAGDGAEKLFEDRTVPPNCAGMFYRITIRAAQP
jgi:hypothetical protein